ncbi:hypothetical protein P7F88_03385 [Vibrio hannami]|uniref:hypothetical protein n=1 Tax=Vibrio hannami TaxID=2717094 RepID=UPI00240F11B3|nr:hypothetical protein [Vibrio hannami]MDG3085193.1 hypothetical protein [Vibrio hannami]
MKKIIPLSLVLASFFSVQTMANDQPPQGQPPSFEEMDTNGDGELQADEVRGPLADHFDEFDKDSSGGLSEEELPPPPPAR